MKIEAVLAPTPVLLLALTKEGVAAEMVRTGRLVRNLRVPLTDAPEAVRAALGTEELVWDGNDRPQVYGRAGEYEVGSVEPTTEEILAAIFRAQTRRAEKIEERRQFARQRIEEELARTWTPPSPGSWPARGPEWPWPASEPDMAELREEYADRMAEAAARYQSERAPWDAEQARLEAQAAAAKLTEEAARAEAEEARAAELEQWVQAHGSDRLKKARAAGYSCKKLLVEELAAHYHPGAVVDWENTIQEKSRSCPSLEALVMAEEVAEAEAVIVWLPRQSLPEGLSTGEAVRIRDPRVGKDLYRMVRTEL